jgi:hypothetical protein
MWIQLDMIKTQVVFSVEIDCTDAGSCTGASTSPNNDLAAGIDIAFSDVPDDWANATVVLSGYEPTANEVIQLPTPGVGRYMRITLAQGKTRWWRVDELVLRQ